MQLEVVKPVVAEPSSARIVEPEPVVKAEPVTVAEPVAAEAPVAVVPAAAEPLEVLPPVSEKVSDSLFPGKPVDPAVSVAASTAPPATTRRRRTSAAGSRSIDGSATAHVEEPPVASRIDERVVPNIPDVAPRVEQSTAPRGEQSTAPRVEQSTAPRVEQSNTSSVDEFERAARLFAFTGENPTVSTAPATPVSPVATTSTSASAGDGAAHMPPRTRRARRITAASLSLAAIGAVGLLTVGMTLPTEAVAAATGTPDTTTVLAGDVNDGGDGDIQAYVASGSAAGGVQGSLQHSSGFTTGTVVQLAGTAGITNVSGSTFSNNQNCPVQWPFAVGVPITYGFGPRPGEFHEGVDFTPGMGAHIQAIADGVVAVAQDNYQGYGTAVIIDHVINGQKVASLYGHMELGSLQVHVGQKVKVGEYIGRTGNTGHSFGAHTHVEIRQNDVTPIDPLPWLRAHNQC